ncbi:unnamed protein product [Diamesa hyperborea]
MGDKYLKVGQKVEIAQKEVRGVVAYVGVTTFAVGKWVGVILDEAKGKNNGSIKGTTYFTCPDNYGMFVRESQCIFLDDAGNPIQDLGSPEEKTTRSRLSSSRLSLAGSRQSLTGSRSHLASPAERPTSNISMTTDKGDTPVTVQTDISVNNSKRASFVETGFLETLKPQFTPGQSLTTPATSNEEKTSHLQTLQDNEEMKNQVRDLTEKLDTLKVRRSEDKERLREFDKMKTQYEQLVEFKSKIMDAQSSLQRELQRSKQETKDAIEARDNHQEEMSELAENVELITLDKEMAEEKADTLTLELETAKERIEELTLDLEILKTEMQEKTVIRSEGADESGGISTYEIKQLEQQNVRLRETLVRMRDLSANEKHENQKMLKELEMKKSEVLELQRTKEKLSSRVDELELQISDLQEQVDAALGAEEMVEQLADKKMELEDRVKSLEEEVTELEALEEVHEQLIESNHDLESDLREELDMANAAKREAMREKEAALETVFDRDQTIVKFRGLVQRLNEQGQELREKMNQETKITAKDIIAETIDFKQVFAESKAHTRAIDLQLRQIELTQVNEHIKYLLAYMPETFLARGSDHDSILVILLVSRIVFKAGIIVTQARERFSAVNTIERSSILQGHDVHQFAFRSRLLLHVHNLQSIMHQFLYGLSVCTADKLLKIGASLPEMIAQEKTVDGIVELLKMNQMDENSSTDNLEKCVSFFNAMYSVLLAQEGFVNETQVIRDCTAAISSACDSIITDSAIIRALIQGGDETSESGLLMQFIIQTSENIKQQLKLSKRRLPQDISITKCNLSTKTLENLRKTVEELNRIMNVLSLTAKQTIAFITSDALYESTTSVSISHDKLWEILSMLSERVYEQDDRGVAHIRNILSSTFTDMSQLAQYLLDNEYEIMSISQIKVEKVVPPIAQRAHLVKKQLEETKTLTATLENKEAEIRQLKLQSKLKQNELSEMQIRKDLAEKKLSVLQQDHESNSTKLLKQYEEVLEKLNSKEKEFEETMDHLQSDIDSLESERGALREKLKVYGNKKGDLKTTTALDITANSPYIAQELSLLKRALNDERDERMKVQANEYQKILRGLKPLHVPVVKDNRIDELEKELHKVKYDLLMSLVKGSEVPSSNTKHGNFGKLIQDHQNRQHQIRNKIKEKAESLASEVVSEYLDRKPYRSTKGFTKFPSSELTQAFNATLSQ